MPRWFKAIWTISLILFVSISAFLLWLTFISSGEGIEGLGVVVWIIRASPVWIPSGLISAVGILYLLGKFMASKVGKPSLTNGSLPQSSLGWALAIGVVFLLVGLLLNREVLVLQINDFLGLNLVR